VTFIDEARKVAEARRGGLVMETWGKHGPSWKMKADEELESFVEDHWDAMVDVLEAWTPLIENLRDGAVKRWDLEIPADVDKALDALARLEAITKEGE
jgi:hypothetical protein